MEFWDVYDKNRKPKGYRILRGGDRRLGKDEYHLTAHVCVFSSDGKMLIQKRAEFKGLWGGLWDITAGGSVLAGESTAQGAERELYEELGIKAGFVGTAPNMTFYHSDCISDYFLLKKDVQLDELVMQSSEVCSARWADSEEIVAMIRSSEFIPYKENFIRLLFDMHNSKTRNLFD